MTGVMICSTIWEVSAVQPLLLVTVTVYSPGPEIVILAVVAPVDQAKVAIFEAEAISVALVCPVQRTIGPLILRLGD
jgi:hypothetical protein